MPLYCLCNKLIGSADKKESTNPISTVPLVPLILAVAPKLLVLLNSTNPVASFTNLNLIILLCSLNISKDM